MKHLFLFSVIILFIACNAQKTTHLTKQEVCDKGELALKFLNEYSSLEYDEANEWIINHPAVTNCVKGIYLEIMNLDYVDVNPVLVAQDIPSGLYVERVEDDLVIIKDKYWEEYVCYVIINNCMIEGIGNINTNHIPGYVGSYESLEPISKPCLDELLSEIDEIYTRINTNLPNYRQTIREGSGENYGTTEGGVEHFYFEDNFFVKIEKVFYGELGNRKIEYYFDDARLRIYIDQYSEYNAPIYMSDATDDGMQPYDPAKTLVKSNRYYFDKRGDMFRWINADNEVINPESEEFLQREKEINRSQEEFQ